MSKLLLQTENDFAEQFPETCEAKLSRRLGRLQGIADMVLLYLREPETSFFTANELADVLQRALDYDGNREWSASLRNEKPPRSIAELRCEANEAMGCYDDED